MNAIEEQIRAFHDAAAQHDGFRSKQGDEIGETHAQVIGLALDGPPGPFFSFLRPRADFLGASGPGLS